MASQDRSEKENTQFVLSLIGLSITSLIIVVFFILTNLSLYRKNPNKFLHKPTKYKYLNYFFSFMIFMYVAPFYSLVLAFKYFMKGYNFIIISLVLFVYLASIISLSILEKED